MEDVPFGGLNIHCREKHPLWCLATRTGGRLSLRGRGLPWHLCCLEGKNKRLLMMLCCSDWDPRILVVDIKGQKPSGTLLLCGVLLIMLELFGTRKIQKRFNS